MKITNLIEVPYVVTISKLAFFLKLKTTLDI